MENTIINYAKFLFWASFIFGSICLLGYMATKGVVFAVGGYLLLIFGSLVNLVAVAAFASYAFVRPEYSKECVKAILFLLINIPIAILYAFIGLSLM